MSREPYADASLSALAETPPPPYYAVIFGSIRTGAEEDLYAAMATRMLELARLQPGYLGFESAHGESGPGLTISYWKDLESIDAWHRHSEHQLAQRQGRDRWYHRFEVRVCRVERAYGFQA